MSYAQTGDNAQRRTFYRVVKRALDIFVSACAVIVAFIPILICAIIVAITSKGAPFLRQERVGRYGNPLYIFKLRSMYADAESNMDKYLNAEQLAQWQSEHKVDNDPRITPFGRFIRATSIDEVPQFLNVLLGEMSIVGPRPVTRDEIDQWFSDTQEELLSVRPGLTGYWQAYARNEATFESGERQRMELEYVRNYSFAMDMRCFFKTFAAVFARTGV